MNKKIKFIITILFVLSTLTFIGLPLYVVVTSKTKIVSNTHDVESRKVGIVFGASVNPNKTPSDILKDRLDTAYELYSLGKIQYVIVSGDNNTKKYNEPSVMFDYLTNLGIPKENVIKDFAGLRTYDTCIRATTLWKVNKAILISQEYHLYRAVYTCQRLGIDSIGLSSTKHIYLNEGYFKVREYFAILKSIIDINIIKPAYIGGKLEGDLSE